MLDLAEHKAYLWKYKLSYGLTKPKKGDASKQVYPFLNKIVESSFDECSSDDVKDAIDACHSIADVFHIVSDEWKDTYFMEVSNYIEEPEFSRLLQEVYDVVGVNSFMNEKTYAFEAERANEEVKQYLYSKGIPTKESLTGH